MKLAVRLLGTGFARADALVNEIRRRALERLGVRLADQQERARAAAPLKPNAGGPTQRGS